MKGWSFSEVLATNSGSASNDLYGKLYVHVRSILGTFRHCLLEHGVTSELLSIDAADLPAYLPKAYFARIEVCKRTGPAALGTRWLVFYRHRTYATRTTFVPIRRSVL